MTCYGCKESLQDENEYLLRINGKTLFHQRCFRCVDCQRDLALIGVGSLEKMQCLECLRKSPAVCSACNHPIDSQWHKRLANRAYHQECLTCDGCRHRFSEEEKECYPIDGKYYCLECHYRERSAKYLRETTGSTISAAKSS